MVKDNQPPLFTALRSLPWSRVTARQHRPITRKTIYANTDLPPTQAPPQQLSELARSHWGIENRLHFVRDTTFAEDAGRIRTGHGANDQATLRNPAVSALRRAHAPEHRRRPPARLLPTLHPPAGPPRHQLTSTASDHTTLQQPWCAQ